MPSTPLQQLSLNGSRHLLKTVDTSAEVSVSTLDPAVGFSSVEGPAKDEMAGLTLSGRKCHRRIPPTAISKARTKIMLPQQQHRRKQDTRCGGDGRGLSFSEGDVAVGHVLFGRPRLPPGFLPFPNAFIASGDSKSSSISSSDATVRITVKGGWCGRGRGRCC
jgi:hypothetical protein